MKKSELPTLAELRAAIDAIDDQMHGLLRQRADIVHTVRRVKGKQAIFIRPGREASMVRALLKRPAGRIPPGLLMRVWREMIGAFTMQEGALRVAVTAGKGALDLWDISRDFYGSVTPLQPCLTPASALKCVQAGAAEVAVLPLPQTREPRPWWQALTTASELQVFAQLPFDLRDAARANWRGNRHGAWAVARLAPEPTGDDHGLLLVWGFASHHAKQIRAALERLKPLAIHEDKRRRCLLVTVDGLLAPEQRRLQRLELQFAAWNVHWRIAGGYAVPIGMA